MGEYLPYNLQGEGGIFESNNLYEKAVIMQLTALKISLALSVTHSTALNTPRLQLPPLSEGEMNTYLCLMRR